MLRQFTIAKQIISNVRGKFLSHKTLVFSGIFATLGITLVLMTYAATFSVTIEPEVSAPSDIVYSDSSASGGKMVKFGAPSGLNQKCSSLSNLKFCDDFDGPAGTLPDSTKWNVFASGSSWGSQCWKKKPENISLDGQGNLKQTLVNTGEHQCTNSYGASSSITSGGMDTKGKFTTKYGRIEVRAKLSCASSVWGAIWLSTGNGPGWPRSGEIDIYELGYNKYGRLQQTVWFPRIDDPATAKSIVTYVDLPPGQRWCDDFHVYGLDWRPNSLKFMVDGQVKSHITPENLPAGTSWPFNDYDLRLLIDLQYGQTGKWTGDPDISQLPSSMYIDYVRVYE